MAKSPAWTRKEGKAEAGGLNAKGRASYNKANPGKPGLKAPQPEGGPRKKSFCSRMGSTQGAIKDEYGHDSWVFGLVGHSTFQTA